MKKILYVSMILIVLCSLFVVPVHAAEGGSLRLTSASGNPGDTITLQVNLNSNPGLVTMTIKVSYDTSVIQLINVSDTGLLVGAQLNTRYSSPYTISWVDGATTNNNNKTGTIAIFTFKILDSAAAGDSKVTLQFIDSYDTDYNENSFSVSSGKVTVNCNHSYGKWDDAGNGQHTRICSACSDIDSNNHIWSNGVVTKHPSCKESGVKTYMCTICSATKTESIGKTADHQYSSWLKVNNTTHKRVCSVCANEEFAIHAWGNGVITKQPTCKEEGIKTYTCTACSGTKFEPIAKTTNHQYDSWFRVNDSTHKHVCTVCNNEEFANHAWGNGVITKQPSCKEEGIKTYACAVCDATKSDLIAKTTNHKYGVWTKVNENIHKHVCSVCSNEESTVHTWNSGNVTKQSSCKETGVKTYTCTGCNAVKTEVIAKLSNHDFDNACDVECNVCGVSRVIIHNYKRSWSKDESGHWYECAVCKERTELADHAAGAEATEKKAQNCTVCGYVIKPALDHKHNYESTWTTDNNGHWHLCSGCEEKEGFSAHDFEDSCDRECSACGFIRETEHIFADSWEFDDDNHWRICTVCHLKKDEAQHEPGAETTATTAQFCTICGCEMTPMLGEHETVQMDTTISTNPVLDEGMEATEEHNDYTWVVVAAAIVVIGSVIVALIKRKKY